MPPHASHGLTGQHRRLAADMLALCSDPGDVPHALDLLNASYATPAAAAARARLGADPAIAPLIAERYWGSWPDLASLWHSSRRAAWATPTATC